MESKVRRESEPRVPSCKVLCVVRHPNPRAAHDVERKQVLQQTTSKQMITQTLNDPLGWNNDAHFLLFSLGLHGHQMARQAKLIS